MNTVPMNTEFMINRTLIVKDCLKAYVRDPYALDLIDKLLVLDPAQQIDSDDALNHDFFWSDPMPSDIKGMLSTHLTSMFEYLAPPQRKGSQITQQSTNQSRNPATTNQTEFEEVRSDRSKMATVEPETTPTTNPPPAEEEKSESNQEVANPEHYIKHPLQNRWALWFFKNDKSKTWQANLRLISKFDTVEDFWALYNHIQLSSNLMPGCDYSLFKDGIEPMWEDEKNKRGGRWLITLNKQQRRSDLDRFWLETLLCLIGESFDDYSDDVCGAVVNVRAKGDKIAIWTTECENRDAVTHIGRVYKERLGLPPKIVIGYQSHADTATKSGSTTKNRFVV